jgi:hypothetical protein
MSAVACAPHSGPRVSVLVYGCHIVTLVSNLPPPSPFDAPGPPPGYSPQPAGAFGAASWGQHRGQPGNRRSAGVVVLLTLVTCGVWAAVWAYQNGDELNRWSGKGIGGGGHLLLTIFLAPVTMFLLAGEVEQLYRDDGQEPPITTLWGLWFLLPIIGNLIWYLRIQRAINDYWTMHGQTNTPGA